MRGIRLFAFLIGQAVRIAPPRSSCRRLMGMAAAGALFGCATPSSAPPAKPAPPPTPSAAVSVPAAPAVRAPSTVTETVILVGRIEVAPALERPTQAARPEEDYRNQALLLFGERPSVLDAPDAPAPVAVTVGEYFFVPYRRTKALYYSGGVVGRSPLRINGYGGTEFAFARPELKLPGRFQIDLKADDRALYLGTFTYTRDAQGVTQVRHTADDYTRTKAELERKKGLQGGLRAAVLRRVD